jgi:hypothetical protein
MKHFILSFMIIVLSLHTASPGAPVEFDQALGVVEALEEKIDVLSWKVKLQTGWLKDPTDLSSISEMKPSFTTSEVVFEPSGKRYHVSVQEVSRWIDGAAPFFSEVFERSFDNKEFREWLRYKHGKELPKAEDSLTSGMLSDDVINTEIRQTFYSSVQGRMAGIGYVAPFYWLKSDLPKKISEYLQEWKKEDRLRSIEEQDDGSWIISVDVDINPKIDFLLKVWYDPTKGGIVTKAIWYGVSGPNIGLLENWRLEIKHKKTPEGFWVPRSAYWVYPLEKRPDFTRLNFKDVKVNPPVDEETFRLTFPNGTRVDDYIHKKLYFVGEIKDEQKSIQAFRIRHQLTGNTPKIYGVSLWRIFSIGLGAFLLIVALYLFIRQRKSVS